MTLRSFYVLLAAIAVTVAPIFALTPAQAAMPPHSTGISEEARADLGSPSLTVHLNADGSLIVSQDDKAGGAATTLPSTRAFPAEIDALVPRKEERKNLGVTADSTVPYRNFLSLMNDAREAGFNEVGIREIEKKQPHDVPSELVIRLSSSSPMLDPRNKPLFVSVGDDGTVLLSLGIPLGMRAEAKRMDASLAGASDAAAGMVPKGRAKKAYFRADFEVPVGKVFGLLRELRAIGFTNMGVMGEATE